MTLTPRARNYALFAIVVVLCALGSLTQTVMNAMLAGVCADFSIDAAEGQWVTTAYMLVMGITVPVITFLARRFSVKAMVYLALAFYLAGALVAFWAPVFWILVAGRVLQAVATGITLPLVQSIAMTRFPAERTGTTMGIAGIAMGFAPNIGPLIGGALVDSWGWRSFFVLMVVVLAIAWIASAVTIEGPWEQDRAAALDVPSVAQSTLGFGGLLLAASNAASLPLDDPTVWVPALFSAAFIVAFFRRQSRIDNPLIDLKVFKSRHFRAAWVAQNCLFGSFMGITLVLPLFVQGPCQMTALDAGIVFIPATVVALFLNPLAGIMTDKVGPRIVTVTGASLLTIGAASFLFVDEHTSLAALTVLQGVRACGVSILVGPLNSWGLSGLQGPLVMHGSAFLALARQVCAALSTAVMVFLVSAVPALLGAGTVAASVAGYRWAFGFSALLAAAVLVCALWKVRPMAAGNEGR